MKTRWIAAVTPLVAGLLLTISAFPLLAQDEGALTPPEETATFTGEPVNGFPNWHERVLLEWTNRSRVDPATDLAACPAGNCEDIGCYSPMPPLSYDLSLTRSARFHSDEMFRQNYFDHSSHCTLPLNISSLYPGSCDGSAGCACDGGSFTGAFARINLFGKSGTGEIIAVWGGVDPVQVFYLWLYENAGGATCAFTEQNGHRWLMLKQPKSVGYGRSDAWYTGDFGSSDPPGKIPSGTHDPRVGPTVDFWVNWYDTAGPRTATVVLDGNARALTLGRGTQTNGAWTTQATNLGTTCHRYYFSFVDSAGTTVTFPATGSYGIGPEGVCADWSSSRTNATPPKGDANGDTVVDVQDVFYLLNYIYSGGPAPV